jgi:hypothetical protein
MTTSVPIPEPSSRYTANVVGEHGRRLREGDAMVLDVRLSLD